MRILSVTPYYPPEGGGLERYAHEILRRLVQRGHEARALSFTRAEPAVTEMDGVPLERRRARLFLGNTPIDPTFRRHVTRVISDFRPDVVVAHTPVPFPAHAAFFAARRAGVPFVTVYHAGRLRGSSRLLDLAARLDRATVDRWMLQGSARIVAVGPYVRQNALRGLHDRTDIVPPGVDLARFTPCAGAGSDRVLFVGPLSRNYTWKGVDVLWSAFRQVHAERPDARLVLVGDGDRRVEFARRAAAEGLPVELPGRLSEEDLLREYRRAAVVVLPSVSDAESFGMVLAEANACGRPVVGSMVGGIPDFVEEGRNGLLARTGDATNLAERIVSLLGDDALSARLAREGRAKVQREHDWDRLADRTDAVLQRALACPV